MGYPKALSEKSIRRMYETLGISEEKAAFMRKFIHACANLYGTLTAGEAWDVYRELSAKTATVLLRRRELYAALGVLRREQVPFYVFEVDEVYSDEKRADNMRIIASRELVVPGYGKFMDLYCVDKMACDKPFFVPKDLLDYTERRVSEFERRLLKDLSGLKSTMTEYETPLGQKMRCKYVGKRLDEFSFISGYDDFELSRLRGEIPGYKPNPEKARELEARLQSVTAARYLVDRLRRESNVGRITPASSIRNILDDLNVMGVDLTEKQFDRLAEDVNDMHNNQNLWCNHGWTPIELVRLSPRGPVAMSFGPGLRELFEDGTLDRDNMVRRLNEAGIMAED